MEDSVEGSAEDSFEGLVEVSVEPPTPLSLAYDLNLLCSSRELIEDGADGGRS